MSDTLVVDAGEMTAEELLEALDGGRRIVVRTEFLGSTHEVTLRHDGETYYCDTPTRLHKHETADEMRTCLERQGYGQQPGG
jgi:hemin uptake protein HemP